MRPYKEFLTVAEIDRELKKIVPKENIFLLGRSKNGRRIFGAKIGSGKKNALVYGFIHSNEAVGAITALELIMEVMSRADLQNKYTWHIIPCVDPDGARLNEGWFKGKLTIKKYFKNFFRPAMGHQVEWTFPFEHKNFYFNRPVPETRLLMKLIDKTKPAFVCPLHNAGIGGAFFLITRQMPPAYYRRVLAVCRRLNIPVALAESGGEYLREIKYPFSYLRGVRAISNNFKTTSAGKKAIFYYGDDSVGYARTKNPNAFGLTPEVPYFADKKISDRRKAKELKKDLEKTSLDIARDVFDFIADIFERYDLNKRSIFYKEIKSLLNDRKPPIAFGQGAAKKKSQRRATAADKYAAEVGSRFYAGAWLGMLRRLIKESGSSKEIKTALRETDKKIAVIIRAINQKSNYHAVPVEDLVACHLQTILATIKYLK